MFDENWILCRKIERKKERSKEINKKGEMDERKQSRDRKIKKVLK
jgi:hypothetical protein